MIAIQDTQLIASPRTAVFPMDFNFIQLNSSDLNPGLFKSTFHYLMYAEHAV